MASPPPLSDAEVHEIREFFTSETAKHVFSLMEYNAQKDWTNAQDAPTRELIWTSLQALYRLIIVLRDVESMKRLDARSQANQKEV